VPPALLTFCAVEDASDIEEDQGLEALAEAAGVDRPNGQDLAFIDDGEVQDPPGLHAAVSECQRQQRLQNQEKARQAAQKKRKRMQKQDRQKKPQKRPKKASDLDLGSDPSSQSIPPRSPTAPDEPVKKNAPGGGNRKLRVGDPSLPEIW